MKTSAFVDSKGESDIVAAIGRAEATTSGEVRVYVEQTQKADDPVAIAWKHFTKLGMHKTQLRNAVLIYVAPPARKFAIIGDDGIHTRCGEAFWVQSAKTMEAAFREGRFSEGIVQAVESIGQVLATEFPRDPGDKDELPNQIVRG